MEKKCKKWFLCGFWILIDMKEEIRREYWSNGKLWRETLYLNRKEHGLAKGWYENGQIYYETLYKNGNRHGYAKSWHENGKVWHEVLFKNDHQHGVRIEFKY
jgi:antitoxin component YwqK of YwqJK toxin-antitoxin module